MRIAAAFAVLALAGCATTLTPDVAQRMSALQLCRGVVTFGPISSGVAQAEIQRRGLDCAPLMPMVQADDQLRRAAAMQMLQNQPAFQPYQLPAPPQRNSVQCQTRRIGDSLYTDCR